MVGVKAREMHGKWRKENSRENGKGVCLVGGSEDNCFLPKSTFCEEKFFSPNGSGDKMDLRWEIAYMPLSTLQVVFRLCVCVCVLCFFFQALNIHFFNYYVNAFFFGYKLIFYICNRCMKVNLYKKHFLSFYFSSQLNKIV